MESSSLFVGLMSGTSLDGVDAVLASISTVDSGGASWEVLGFVSRRYESPEREAIRAAIDGTGAAALARLGVDIAEGHALAVHSLLEMTGVDATEVRAVGFHGQTVSHLPPTSQRGGATLQIGDAATLAERVGIDVVHDFRSRDVAAGGHGAPLVAWPDAQLFSHPTRRRVLQNLGGMANVTWLPGRAEAQAPGGFDTLAFDTGPGVALIDRATFLATGGELNFDDGGRLASAGVADQAVVARLLELPFFDEEPPRTTGRELFGDALVGELARDLPQGQPEAWVDLIATLVAFTAESIAHAYRRWVIPRGVDEAFLLGGGALNPALVSALGAALPELAMQSSEALGLDPNAREALCFAALAWGYMEGMHTNVHRATGAAGPRRLGSFTPAR